MNNTKKVVFWSPVAPCIERFLVNPSLPQLANNFPYVFVCSNGSDEKIESKGFKKSIILNSENNDMREKGTIAFQCISKMNFDICIRIDIDAIVFDLDELIRMASGISADQFAGWKITRKKRTYIRGGCHVCGCSFLRKIPPLGQGKSFDLGMADQVDKIKPEIVEIDLFEINEEYTGKTPVWHPPKQNKDEPFFRHVEKWKKLHGS